MSTQHLLTLNIAYESSINQLVGNGLHAVVMFLNKEFCDNKAIARSSISTSVTIEVSFASRFFFNGGCND